MKPYIIEIRNLIQPLGGWAFVCRGSFELVEAEEQGREVLSQFGEAYIQVRVRQIETHYVVFHENELGYPLPKGEVKRFKSLGVDVRSIP